MPLEGTLLTELSTYKDENGNEIRFNGRIERGVKVIFRGSNNTLIVDDDARLGDLSVNFDCDNGVVTIGSSKGKHVSRFSAGIRVGQDCSVHIGNDVSSTGTVTISAAEGVRIDIGDDVMFASRNQLRADDGHPIFDVKSGKRVNPSRSITIGDHVWLAFGVIVLGGASIGSGSVIGIGSLVSRHIPNNCVAVGVPTRVIRKNIAWERPHLTLTKPYYKPDATTLRPTRKYWQLTETEVETEPAVGGETPPLVRTALRDRLRDRLAREYARRFPKRG